MVQLIKENGSILGFLSCVSFLQCTILPICTSWSLLALPEILCASIGQLQRLFNFGRDHGRDLFNFD